MSDFLKEIIKETGNEYASLVSDGAAGDVDSFIDTGSYIFNALLGGSIHRGLPSNKITAIAGESATGKTFFVLGMCKNFLDKNPDGGVIFFESENAVSKEMIENLQDSKVDLRDPNSELSVQPVFAKNAYRSLKPRYFIVEGICTHLGCAPIEKFALAAADMGPDWQGGFYSPCHGSKFDLSGRVYAGVPAPSNLRIPPHRYEDENTVIIGETEDAENV